MMRIVPFAVLIIAMLAGTANAQKPTTPADTSTAKAPMVNINTATVAELEQLPGIGAKVAARIVEYRTKKGLFRKTEELMNVQGIGEKSFLKLRPQLTVGNAASTSQQ